MNEIVRKFLPKELPDLIKSVKVKHERYYLYLVAGIELRVQRIGDEFELQRKFKLSELSRGQETWKISEDEFEILKKIGSKKIVRDYYLISKIPEISVVIYHEEYEGLTRIEVDFNTEEEARKFVPLPWFGKEISDSEIGRDGKLIGLTRERFLETLNRLK